MVGFSDMKVVQCHFIFVGIGCNEFNAEAPEDYFETVLFGLRGMPERGLLDVQLGIEDFQSICDTGITEVLANTRELINFVENELDL